MRYGTKWPTYAQEWDRMVINPDRVDQFTKYAEAAITNKARYEAIEALTNVKWYHIAVIHRRESDASFNTYLGNGDPLGRVTRNVPRGRGPWSSFEAGAVDALKYDALTSVVDWRLEKILYYCEVFNGAGYDMHGLPSPYIWGGTNIQKPGKYTLPASYQADPPEADGYVKPVFYKAEDTRYGDGQWNPGMIDGQPGCAPMLWMIAKLDPTVIFVRETPPSLTAEAAATFDTLADALLSTSSAWGASSIPWSVVQGGVADLKKRLPK